MSRPALLLLLLIAASITTLCLAPEQAQWLTSLAKLALVLSSPGLMIALLIGKRVKFDPVLR